MKEGATGGTISGNMFSGTGIRSGKSTRETDRVRSTNLTASNIYYAPSYGNMTKYYIVAAENRNFSGIKVEFGANTFKTIAPNEDSSTSTSAVEKGEAARQAANSRALIFKKMELVVRREISAKTAVCEALKSIAKCRREKPEFFLSKYRNADNNGLTQTYQKISTTHLYLNFPRPIFYCSLQSRASEIV